MPVLRQGSLDAWMTSEAESYSVEQDVRTSSRKRHPGREAGPQSHGSLADSRAAEVGFDHATLVSFTSLGGNGYFVAAS
jgi:hypothetical protein